MHTEREKDRERERERERERDRDRDRDRDRETERQRERQTKNLIITVQGTSKHIDSNINDDYRITSLILTNPPSREQCTNSYCTVITSYFFTFSLFSL